MTAQKEVLRAAWPSCAGLAIWCLVATAIPTAAAAANAAVAKRDLALFLNRPSIHSWGSLERDVVQGVFGSTPNPVLAIMAYDTARITRDFPNMMIMEGITAEELEAETHASLEGAMKEIREVDGAELWLLLRAMVVQGFDPGVAHTGAEIAARLSRSPFEELVTDSPRLWPKNEWEFNVVREQWVR